MDSQVDKDNLFNPRPHKETINTAKGRFYKHKRTISVRKQVIWRRQDGRKRKDVCRIAEAVSFMMTHRRSNVRTKRTSAEEMTCMMKQQETDMYMTCRGGSTLHFKVIHNGRSQISLSHEMLEIEARSVRLGALLDAGCLCASNMYVLCCVSTNSYA